MADTKVEIQVVEDWKVQYVRRDDNQATHLLAREAVQLDLNNTWGCTPPACIQEVLLMEHLALAI
jgi:hypothetical protein